MATTVDIREENRWWEPRTGAIAALLENEVVYLAVHEFITSDDADTTLRWLRVPPRPGMDESDSRHNVKGLSLTTFIDGRGAYADIEHIQSIRELVEEEIDGRAGTQGPIEDNERAFLEALEDEFRSLADLIRARLAK